MSKATKDALESLHGIIASELTERIQSGEATAAEFTAAIKFLKDNDIARINLGELGEMTSVIDSIEDSDLPENVMKFKGY